MKSKATLTPLAVLCICLSCAFVGCKKARRDAESSQVSATAVRNSADAGHHAHPEHGPRGGELIELGQEAYHAELVHGKSGISIYLLDGSATQAVPIAAKSLMISMKHGGRVKQFALAAAPDSNVPAGRCSRFVSTDPQLDQWMDGGAEGAIVIRINGKSYTGQIAHDHHHHSHAGHTH